MRAALLCLAVVAVGCASAAPEPTAPGVHVELALVNGEVRPPVFRWDAPVASRVTVLRGRTVVWEVSEADANAGGSVRRGPLTPPLVYGDAFGDRTGPQPRVLVAPAVLLPGRVYTVSVVGYDGTVFQGRFSVQAEIAP